MGANFNTMRLNPGLSRDEVHEKFYNAQEDDRFENGHSYSGGFGMASGLEFCDMHFKDEREAEEWLEDNAQKWGNALAVTFGDDKQILIGANCAS